MTYPKACIRGITAATCLLSASAHADVKLQPLHAGLAIEYGQMNGLYFFEGAGANKESYTINRTIGWVSQEATINERFDVNLALGGLFFQFFPYNKGFSYSRVRNSAVSIGQASATYKFGDVESPSLALSVGLMPYKYSPDSKNLGEYLFRSEPYPTTTINGSWDLINSSYSKVKGLLFEKDFLDGKWKNDFLLTLSDEVHPLNDLSIAYITSLKMGPLEVGAGVNFYHLLPASPSITTPESPLNSYITYQGKTYSGDGLYYQQIGLYYADRSSKRLAAKDTAGWAADSLVNLSWKAVGTRIDSLNHAEKVDSLAPGTNLNRQYYTFKGTLLMGRASLDIGSLIGDNVDLKLFGEVDVLGWTNYPIFFEKRSERMPLMLGMTVPTMGLLDNLTLEVEYWKNYYPIMSVKTIEEGLPKVDYGQMSPKIDISQPYTKDDLKWSVSAARKVGEYFTLYGQVANDHTRPIRYDFSPYKYETMLDPGAWYYVLRMQVSM
jgi:hypothetical protein